MSFANISARFHIKIFYLRIIYFRTLYVIMDTVLGILL